MARLRDDIIERLKRDSCGLTLDEQAVLDLRFGLTFSNPLTLSAVGAQLGKTMEPVRQIEKAALQKLTKA